ncbi:voltage-dependent anion channel-domain-containing protein [Coprinopsis sp. MPI-PUGE-AT-0042]|nr:voltage-dependent anion channel-domain-containing protein [Coprinopsis sp. MPI-PUGE-AT-0042]
MDSAGEQPCHQPIYRRLSNGAATLLTVAVEVIYGYYGFGGKRFLYTIWGLWWVDVAVSIVCAWLGVHNTMFVKHPYTLATMNSMWLLPVVTLIVASSAGQVLTVHLLPYSPQHALVTAGFSAFIVTVGLSLALMILTIYLARLVIHGLPPTGAILTVFLPLGPAGQAGFSIYLLGVNMRRMLPFADAGHSVFLGSSLIGETIYAVCVATAFVLWSTATMWLIYGLLALNATLRRSRPGFKMGFWGVVFPNGVYANLTLSLAEAFDSGGLRVYGAMYAVIVICLWTGIALRSIVALKEMCAIKPKPNVETKGEEEGEQELPPIEAEIP